MRVNHRGHVHSLLGDRPFFSQHLPAGLQLALNSVLAVSYQNRPQTSGSTPIVNEDLAQRIRQIKQDWPDCIDPRIALFKLYFRAGNYLQAEREVWDAIGCLCASLGIRKNYRLMQPDQLAWLENDSEQRHLLFCLKALGVIRLRRGKVAMAKSVLTQLQALDPHDEIGGASYLHIAESFEYD